MTAFLFWQRALLKAAVWIGVIALMLTMALFSSGCSLNNIRSNVAVQGAELADQVLGDSIWGMCNGTSVGAIRRWLGNNKDRAAAWQGVCLDPSGELPITTWLQVQPKPPEMIGNLPVDTE